MFSLCVEASLVRSGSSSLSSCPSSLAGSETILFWRRLLRKGIRSKLPMARSYKTSILMDWKRRPVRLPKQENPTRQPAWSELGSLSKAYSNAYGSADAKSLLSAENWLKVRARSQNSLKSASSLNAKSRSKLHSSCSFLNKRGFWSSTKRLPDSSLTPRDKRLVNRLKFLQWLSLSRFPRSWKKSMKLLGLFKRRTADKANCYVESSHRKLLRLSDLRICTCLLNTSYRPQAITCCLRWTKELRHQSILLGIQPNETLFN